MSTIEGSGTLTRDALTEPTAGIDRSTYERWNTIFFGKARFAFNPLADHPLASDFFARQRLLVDLFCRKAQNGSERIRPWTLKCEGDLIVVSDWASKYRREFPDKYDDDRDFYTIVQEMFRDIVKNPPTEAPPFEVVSTLERDRKLEEERLLREYKVDCDRGGFCRTIAAWLESLDLKEPPPMPEIDPLWDYRRFLAHNGQMNKLVRWFSQHTEQIDRYCNGKSLT